MADPIFGEGATIEVDDGAASAFVVFADVTSIDPPDNTVIEVERNRLSVTTMTEKAFSGRLELGECSFTYEGDYTKYNRVELLKRVSHAWKVTLADGTRFAFTGTLKTNKAQGVQGGAINMAQCTVRLTTLITLTDFVP